MSEPKIAEAADGFREALEELWQARHMLEEEIARKHAPVSEQVTFLLEAVARTVSEVTGYDARLDEMKGTFHAERQTLLTHHTIHHSGSEFHVRILYGPECIEYSHERLDHADVVGLLARISRKALEHFGPKRA